MYYFSSINISGHYEGFSAYVAVLAIALIIFAIGIILFSPALILVAVTRRQAEKIRNLRVNTVVTQYDPPRDLSPAQIGLLYDMRCGNDELRATLFDLQQRGIITFLDSKKVKIINAKTYPHLAEYEKIAIKLAGGETDTLKLPKQTSLDYIDPITHELEFSTIPYPSKKSLLPFKFAVQKSIEQKGIDMNNYFGAFILRVILLTFILGLTPLLLTGSGSDPWSASAFTDAFYFTLLISIFIFPVYIVNAFFLVWAWTKIAGRYWLNTKQARAVWPELEGYRLYLKQVDLDNIQFESKNGNIVTETMPYAMVFGLDTKWRDRINKQNAL